MAPPRMFRTFKKWFDDSDAQYPLEFNYVRQLIRLLSSVGSWPHNQFGRHRLHLILSIYNLFLIAVAITISSAAAAYIWFYRETISFSAMGHVILCILLETLYLQRMLTGRTKKYGEIVRDLLKEFHLFYFQNRSQYASKMFKQVQLISKIFTMYVTFHIISGVSLFTFQPWFNNYRNGMFGDDRPANKTFEHSLYFYCFTDQFYTTVNGYWILFFFNIPTSFHTSSGILTYDLLLSLIVFQILGHLKIMKNDLLRIPSTDDIYSVEENMRVRDTLKGIIDHHNIIIKFVDKCSDAFSNYLFMFYMLMQLLTIVVTVEVTSFTADALAKYGPLTLAIYQPLIQISILFEMISTQSEKLVDAIYEVPWECMDTSNRRTVMFFLLRAQTPVTLKAAKMVPVGVMTMTAVLKTTFSYYMLLNAIAESAEQSQA
ncbi:odorant receptor 49b-like [Leguminivora glycinivorella]|uniref:odorant receptor 49b-like n=1 Tax=Leguminivora glycinivorella TaxID=1035111 RepID=UPI00200E81B1|nr:odorant receptor 49b-like [Leguminivora glycinivorella]